MTTAATLHAQGKTDIATAQDAEALRPLAGAGAYWLFTVGLVGTGMLAVLCSRDRVGTPSPKPRPGAGPWIAGHDKPRVSISSSR